MGYGRVDESLLTSSLWLGDVEGMIPERRIDDVVLRVWMVFLLKARDGMLEMSVKGIARSAACTLAQTEEALAILEAPDPDSTTKVEEGRRLLRAEDGSSCWMMVNHEKYRKLHEKGGRAEYMADYMRKRRADGKDEATKQRGKDAKALLDFWFEEYTRTVGKGKQKPVVSKPQAQMEAAKRLLASVDLDTAKRIVTRHLTDKTTWWYRQTKHELVHVVGAANEHLARMGDEDARAPVGPAVDDPRRRSHAERE